MPYHYIRDEHGNIQSLETNLTGKALLTSNRINKECAFTHEERKALGLLGKLPYHVETLDDQTERTYRQFSELTTLLEKNVFLNHIFDVNATLFYRVVQDHLEEMLPIIYTPTVGDVVQKYSLEHRTSRGIFISYPDRDHIDTIIENRNNRHVDLIVVTDGEAVLGIGDQGVGGIDIPISKLMVYTLCAGISPNRVLPIQLDVGTNNAALLKDPMYLGWRHARIQGAEYDAFIRDFVQAIKKAFPNVYLHWEDFGRDNARKNLETYRKDICSFNDDMQGTGIVTLACVLAGVQAANVPLTEQTIVIFGAGTAGCGVADQIHAAMVRQGLSPKEAYQRFWLIDRTGLLVNNGMEMADFQRPYARDPADVADWKTSGSLDLLTVVTHTKNSVLIGASAVAGAFTEQVVRTMATHHTYPIILPLSNPTSRAEATPANILAWTDGRALIACGSPFAPVVHNGKTIRISQSNNALVYPGLGLGVLAAKASYVSDDMLWVACQTLSSLSPARQDPQQPLLPNFTNILEKSKAIALAVARQAIKEGVAHVDPNVDLEHAICTLQWQPIYYPYRKMES